MKINDEVTQAVVSNYATLPASKIARAVINAYLKSVWKPFDKDDKSTWTDDMVGRFICRDVKGKVIDLGWSGYAAQDVWQYYDVTHYLDPADILPEKEGEEW